MREGHEYHCPQCGDTSPAGTTCIDCGIPMIDERGNQPLRPSEQSLFEEWWEAWTIGGSLGFVGAIAGGLFAGTVGLLAGPALLVGGAATVLVPRRLQLVRRRRWARELLERAGEPVKIAGAATGLVRIRGKVKVLGESSFAAYERSPRDRKCWRFVVHDGSGPAVVDDDCFEIWRSDLRKRGGTIEGGAQIDVIGRAVLRPAPDPDLVGSLRDSMVPVFEGTPGTPVLLLI
ncbi:MAG: hypothetical protein HYY06_32045 [Deltaproteobacteria bacterium]|nr:hypothetical protein [Deltaproteobacteria bacterium]